MASMSHFNGHDYYRITKTVGHKLNEAGNEVLIRKAFYGKTKKEANAKYKAYIEKQTIIETTGINDKSVYFGKIADSYIEEILLKDTKIKDRTKYLYVRAWNKNIRPLPLYSMQLKDINTMMLQKTYNNLECATSTKKYINRVMISLFQYLESQGLSRNLTNTLVISQGIDKDEFVDQEEKKITTWTDEEIEKIMGGFDKASPQFRYRFLIVLAYYTGCRIGELLALTYNDITENGIVINKQLQKKFKFDTSKDYDYNLAIVSPKSKSANRTLPVNEIVLSELKKHKAWHLKEQRINVGFKQNYYIFATCNGDLPCYSSIVRTLDRYYDRIGIEHKPPHTYRHTFATNLARNGVRLETLAKLLGHSKIDVTAQYYIGINENDKVEAINSITKYRIV